MFTFNGTMIKIPAQKCSYGRNFWLTIETTIGGTAKFETKFPAYQLKIPLLCPVELTTMRWIPPPQYQTWMDFEKSLGNDQTEESVQPRLNRDTYKPLFKPSGYTRDQYQPATEQRSSQQPPVSNAPAWMQAFGQDKNKGRLPVAQLLPTAQPIPIPTPAPQSSFKTAAQLRRAKQKSKRDQAVCSMPLPEAVIVPVHLRKANQENQQ